MPAEQLTAFHTLTTERVAAQLGTDPARGLSTEEVARRQIRYGTNTLRKTSGRGLLRMATDQFTDFMILLLIAAALLSGFIGDIEDSVVILIIVVLNAAVGFVQQYRAERAMSALKQLASLQAIALRDGGARSIPAEALVPGDVVLLEAGSVVSADLRLLDAVDLKLDEAALTGESLPVEKIVEPLDDPALPIGDRRNMAFKGSVVLYGRARGLVVATGMATELGRIARLLESAERQRTPLQRRLSVFGQQIGIGAVAICLFIFVLGLLRGEPPLLMLLTALSLAVAAVPEALPAVVTVLLALGASRMARQNALIRRLPAVETLGSVTTICSDKTGTLTRNEMQVSEVYVDGRRKPVAEFDPASRPGRDVLRIMALCNDVEPASDGTPLGDPTEMALWQAAAAAGAAKTVLAQTAPRLLERPFDSERKRMSTLHADQERVVAYVKGAPETVLPRCRFLAGAHREEPLDIREASAEAEAMAENGLRVLALAYRRFPSMPEDTTSDAIERELTLVGLVGLLDPPRPEAAAAVAICRAAGIAPVMITGDHPATARAVARQIGLAETAQAVISGRELVLLSDAELRERVQSVCVYARVDPEQKLRIVAALQASGHIVAMTGDGVNDAPALARADIGVAMGRIGTDVAREASSLVLLDDNFATIVAAVREGRRIYDNIRKFIRFVVSCNLAEIGAILLAPMFGMPVPLLPIQILWINLVTDGMPGLALAAEPAEDDVMRRPPRPPRESLFARGMLRHVAVGGLVMTGITLGTQAVAMDAGLPHWQTMVFTVLSFVQMAQIMAIRSERASLFELSLLSNKPMLGAVGLTILLQLAVIYIPVLNTIFYTEPLSLAELIACCAASSLVLASSELDKWFVRRRRVWM